MKKLIVIALITAAVAAYKKGRRYSAEAIFDDYPPYQGTTQHRYLSLQEHHRPFPEQSVKTSQYPPYRHRFNRHGSSSFHPDQLPLRDQLLLRDYSLAKNRSFDDGSSFAEASYFKGHSSFLADGTALGAEGDDRFSHRHSFRDDYRFADLYDAPIATQAASDTFPRDSEYLKDGNGLLDYVSVSPTSPSTNSLPLREEASTSVAPTITPATARSSSQESTVSVAAQAIGQLRTSATSEPKIPSLKCSHTPTMPPAKSDTLIGAAATSASTPTASTLSTSPPVGAHQSANLAPSKLPALTTEATLPVASTESPVVSFGRHTLSPIALQAAKLTVPASYRIPDDFKNRLEKSLLDYLASQREEADVKSSQQALLLNHAFPETLNNSLNKIEVSLPDYILSEDSKGTLKNSLQSSALSNLFQQQSSSHGLPFQQSSLSEIATTNYLPPVSLSGRARFALPSLSIAPPSAISRPLQTMKNLPTTIPRASVFAGQDSAASSILPLVPGVALSSGLHSGLADSHAANVFTSDISVDIPAGLPSVVPASVPSFNFAQNAHHLGHQLRKFQATRSEPYSTGLQMQLGGFGGIDYTLLSANPASRAPRIEDLGIARVPLGLPELPRHPLSSFSKFSFEQPV